MAHISVFGLHTAYLLGFERIADVRGLKSIRPLLAKDVSFMKKAVSFCGIYLQIRPGQRAYIGQTTNLAARFERHLAQGVIIEELAFMPMETERLDEEERRLIELAQKQGIALDNLAIRDKQTVEGKKFESFFTQEEIDEWLHHTKTQEPTSWRNIYDNMLPSLRHQLDLAMGEPVWYQALRVARLYVKHLIPKPMETNEHLWTCTAYTKKPDERYVPLIRLHADTQILLSIGYCADDRTHCWGYLWCDAKTFIDQWESIERFTTRFPYMRCESVKGGYRLWTSRGLMQTFVENEYGILRSTVLEVLKKRSVQENNAALAMLLAN